MKPTQSHQNPINEILDDLEIAIVLDCMDNISKPDVKDKRWLKNQVEQYKDQALSQLIDLMLGVVGEDEPGLSGELNEHNEALMLKGGKHFADITVRNALRQSQREQLERWRV